MNNPRPGQLRAASRGARAVAAYRSQNNGYGGSHDAAAAIDLIADILHHANRQPGWDAETVLMQAQAHFDAEKGEPAPMIERRPITLRADQSVEIDTPRGTITVSAWTSDDDTPGLVTVEAPHDTTSERTACGSRFLLPTKES